MPTVTAETLQPGSVIDSFEIRGVLGVGGFGITYEAHDRSLDCRVAIKEYFPSGLAVRAQNHTSLSPATEKNSEAFDYGLKRFLAEARTLAKFQEPNVVRVSRFLEANGTAYLVMDFEDGRPLSDVIARLRRLNEKQAKAVVANILRGLRAVHAKKFLHRDIKPGNILVRRTGPPVLLDFGAARIALEEQAGGLTVMLTPGYAPIEQYSREEKQGPWSDIYAMGATAYHCITGHAPPPATDRLAQTHHGLADPAYEVLDALGPDYSSDFVDAIKWMMELGDIDRPRTAGQALAAVLGRATRTAPQEGVKTAGHLESKDLGLITRPGLDSPAPATLAPSVSFPAPAGFPSQEKLPAEVITTAREVLAQFIGPIAKVIVERVAAGESDIGNFHEKLAGELNRDERDEFLRRLEAP